MKQLNQHCQRALWVLLFVLSGIVLNVQDTKAEITLNSEISEKSELQAQLNASTQTLQLRNVQVGTDGLALVINGNPQVSTSRVANPERLIVDLQGTEVTPGINNTVVPVNRYGVRQVRVTQLQPSPAIARLVLDLDNANPVTWQSSFDIGRGLLLLRPSNVANSSAVNTNITNLPVASRPITSISPTTIDGLAFNGYGQLVIQASRAIAYRSSFDSTSNTYNFTIPATRIAPQFRRPVLGANSPIEQIRLNQVGDAVVISIKTITGWQIQETIRTNSQAIALQLNSTGQVSTNIPKNNNSQTQTNSNTTGRQLVVIDPGHGGPDVGATRNGVYEKTITLAMSKQLGRILQQMGYAVVYTRTDDIDLDLEPRVQIAENSNASVFVSVHVNSLSVNASQVSGVETYYAPGSSLGKNLADLVHNQILAGTGADDRSVRSARFYVIRNTSMPAILVETGYITNPSEASKLVTSAYQEQMAAAIAKGVDQFLKSYRR